MDVNKRNTVGIVCPCNVVSFNGVSNCLYRYGVSCACFVSAFFDSLVNRRAGIVCCVLSVTACSCLHAARGRCVTRFGLNDVSIRFLLSAWYDLHFVRQLQILTRFQDTETGRRFLFRFLFFRGHVTVARRRETGSRTRKAVACLSTLE